MQLTMRMYGEEDDYWRIRTFLREVFMLNGRRELSWQTYRFDYCRRHIFENIEHMRMEDVVFIWETPGGEIALATSGPDSVRRLRVWANEHDDMRRAALLQRGYTRGDLPEYQRYRPLSLPVPDAPTPPGYIIRAMGDVEEHPARSFVSWKACHPDATIDKYEGADWYRNVQRAPLYRRDLDLVAMAPDGEMASFCTICFDGVTRTGAFEPVGTAPAHRRIGLGKAVLCEGLRRLKSMGATMAYVGSYSEAAHALCASVGFTDYELSEPLTSICVLPVCQ